MNEVCEMAAIKVNLSGQHPIIVCGKRHHNCFETMHKMGIVRDFKAGYSDEQGFLTSLERFVTRLEGRKLQDAAGIASVSRDGYCGNGLFSEDLY